MCLCLIYSNQEQISKHVVLHVATGQHAAIKGMGTLIFEVLLLVRISLVVQRLDYIINVQQYN